MRVRSVSKIGKGRYLTTSYKFSDYIIANILMGFFALPFLLIYWMCKYCIYMPTKLLIQYLKKDK